MNKYVIWFIRIAFSVFFFFLIKTGNLPAWLGLYLLGVAIAPLFGRIYCGYICPMNTVMRPIQYLSSNMKIQRKSMPTWMESPVLPWVMLVLTILAMVLGKRFLQKEIPVLIILIGISAVVTIFFPSRFFHNSLCPYSLLLRFTGKWSLFTRQVDPETCSRCTKCVKVCPSHAITMTGPGGKAQIDPALCHQCESCSQACTFSAISYKKR
jgi:ferredoxin-type protein NapH